MTLYFNEETGYFAFLCYYTEKNVPKEAGFKWDPRRKVWFTHDIDVAIRLIDHAEVPAREEIQRRIDQQKDSLLASRSVSSELEIPSPEGLSYLPFQKAGVAYSLERKSTLIADEMGLGKTIQALGIINVMKAKNILVVCPNTLKLNWKREAEKWLINGTEISILSGSPPPSLSGMCITNYEGLFKFGDAAVSSKWDVIVIDEAHYVKNAKTKRSGAIRRIINKHPKARLLMLTGTPIVNRPVELFNILQLADVDFAKNFWDYAKRYCNAHLTRFGWDLTGASHLQELQDKLRSSIMIRRLKKDVLKELPKKRRQIIELAVDGLEHHVAQEKKLWDTFEQQSSVVMQEMNKALETSDEQEYKKSVKKLRELQTASFTEMSEIRHRTALVKVPKVIEHVKSILETEHKVVVFAHHLDVIDSIAYGLINYDAVVLTGEINTKDRQKAVDTFQNDPSVRVFVGSIQAGGVGITLTAASVVVFAELDWVPGNITQAEDRLHRIGQELPVLVQHLVLDGSIDARLAKKLVKKQGVIEKALDNKVELNLDEIVL